jgi:hypothetical protein
VLQLADGSICSLAQGTSGIVNGDRVNYFCSDGKGIVGEPTQGVAWTARRVANTGGGPPNTTPVPEEVVQLKTVWR